VELQFGTYVREYGQQVGRLAGFELDPATRRVRKIIFSSDGELGNHVMMRPFASVLAEPGEIDIRPYTPTDEDAAQGGVVVGHLARIKRGDREVGRVTGIDVSIGTGDIEAVIGRKNWLTRRFRVDGRAIDLSVPGEVRTGSARPAAA
jgi:sporulation protein YlmC with PRC-barrel domain